MDKNVIKKEPYSSFLNVGIPYGGWVFILIMIMIACNQNTLKQDTFVGIWRSESGQSILYLNKNGTCKGILDTVFFQSYYSVDFYLDSIGEREISGCLKTMQFSGQWHLNTEKTFSTDFVPNIRIKNLDEPIDIILGIKGSKGILSNKPPWYLFFYIGDPDDYNLYKFINQNEKK
jgi:hypothetical protein